MEKIRFHLLRLVWSASVVLLVSSCYSYKPLPQPKDIDYASLQNSVHVGITYRFRLKDGRTRELKVKSIEETKLVGSTVRFDVSETLPFRDIESFQRKRISVLETTGLAVFFSALALMVLVPLVSSPLGSWW